MVVLLGWAGNGSSSSCLREVAERDFSWLLLLVRMATLRVACKNRQGDSLGWVGQEDMNTTRSLKELFFTKTGDAFHKSAQ